MSQTQSNLLLDSLSEQDRQTLLPQLEAVSLSPGSTLFEAEQTPRYIYFLTSGIASIISEMADGEVVEVGLVGREGLPGSYRLLGSHPGFTRCFVQSAGTALRMDYGRFQACFDELPSLHRRVLEHVQYEAFLLERLAACNRVHEAEERLARWLLMLSDRTGQVESAMTQDFLAQMLGTRRTTVTLVAGTLQNAGLIAHRRGFLKILDRSGLEDAACECYAVTRRLLNELYAKEPASSAT